MEKEYKAFNNDNRKVLRVMDNNGVEIFQMTCNIPNLVLNWSWETGFKLHSMLDSLSILINGRISTGPNGQLRQQFFPIGWIVSIWEIVVIVICLTGRQTMIGNIIKWSQVWSQLKRFFYFSPCFRKYSGSHCQGSKHKKTTSRMDDRLAC